MIRLVLNYQGSDLPTHELVGDFVFISRALSNQIVIDHPAVSAQHALLLRVRDSYWLKDLNQRTGHRSMACFVTDAELNDGDKIRFGSVLAVFAGCCCKRTSKRGVRKFWTSIAV
jgi:pSer/pThr/pTyr-binding forkhead associated (FHA) protein